MIAEDLKRALGEDLSKQVEEALKGKGKDGKDLDCVVGNDGSYVPAKKYDDMKNDYDTAKKEADTLRASQKSIQDEYENYKKGSITQADYDAKVKEIQEEADNKIKQNNFDNKLALKLMSKEIDAKDSKDIIANLDLSKISLDGENFIGLDEQIKDLKEKKDYLFNKTTVEILGNPGADKKKVDDDVPDLSKMSYDERCKYLDENPDVEI